MKRLGLIISLFLLVLTVPHAVEAACCTGRGCNPSNLPPFACAPSHCDTQAECDAKLTPAQSGGTGSSFDPFAKCGGGASGEIDTAIGCIPTNFTLLFDKFFKLGIGIAGGTAFLLILFGGFQILTSSGNPEQLAAGRELVTSAITGLLMIIFSVFLLQVIGVDILGIPGFLK